MRRQKEPGEVYQERLSRVFYENYIGSIVDWYAATLMRREPMLLFEGSDEAAKSFFNVLSDDCDLKGTNLTSSSGSGSSQALVCGQQLTWWWTFRGRAAPARTRAEEDATRAVAGVPGGLHGGRSHQLELRPDGRAGVGGDPDDRACSSRR